MSSHQGSEPKKAEDPRLTVSSDAADSGEANSAPVVRSAAGVRKTTTEYVDPEIPSSSTAAASSGEATPALGDLYADSPPRPFGYNVFEDPTSMFNVEFRDNTPRRRPSRVIGAPHFLDDSFEWFAETEKEYWFGLYRDGFITKARYEEILADLRQEQKNRQLRRRLANLADLARQKASLDGSSSAADAAASETPAVGVTDTDASDFPSVVSSGVVSGTTAPSTPVTSNDSTEADEAINTAIAASNAQDSSNATTIQPSVSESVEQTTRDVSVDLMRGQEVLTGEDAENLCAQLRFRPRKQQRQQAEVESDNKDSDDEDDSEDIQDLSTSFALIGLVPKNTETEEDVDAMSKSLANVSVAETSEPTRDSTVSSGIPTSTNASQVGETTDDLTQYNIQLMPLHTNADPDPTMYNFAKTIINPRRSTSAPPTTRPPASSTTTRPSQESNGFAQIHRRRNLPDEPTSYNVQNDAFKEAVETTSNILQRNSEFIYVDPMSPLNETAEPSTSTAREESFESMDFEYAENVLLDNEEENTVILPRFFCQPPPSPEVMDVDESVEPIEVDNESEAMEVDQVPKEHRPAENDVDFEMIDESIEAHQSTTSNITSSITESSVYVPSGPIYQVSFAEPSQTTPAQRMIVEAHAIPAVHATIPMNQPSDHVISLNGTSIEFSSSMNTNPIVENMDVNPVMALEDEECLVVNAVFNVQPPVSDNLGSNTTIESPEATLSITSQPPTATIVEYQPTADITIQDPNPPTVLGSSESLLEAPTADQENASSSKPASMVSQATKELDSQEKPSRDRLNEVVEHHQRRAMFPTVRFSPQHSVMKRRSAQRSRLALICHINRQRTQQMMKIKQYNAVVEKPVDEAAAHHRRQHELTAATQNLPESSLPHPITAGQPSRLALLSQANRESTQQTTTMPADQAPSTVNAEVPPNATTSNVVVAEPTSSVSAVHCNDNPSDSAASEQVESVIVGDSSEHGVEKPTEQQIGSQLPQRKFRSSHLERAFAEQHRKAPITRQELASFDAFVEQANRDRETSNAVRPSLQPPRRPFQTRIGRIWDAIKDDGRPIGQAIKRPAPFYSNDESIIRRKQEGAQCQASSSTASIEDTEGPNVSSEVAVVSPQPPAEVNDTVVQEPAVADEVEEVDVPPQDAVDDASQDHEPQDCNHRHIIDLPKHGCDHKNAAVLKEIARHYVMCHLCGMPIAPRLITESDNELTDSEDEEPEAADVDNASAAQDVQIEADVQLGETTEDEEELPQYRQDEVVEVEQETSGPDDAEIVDETATIAAPPQGQVDEVPGEINDLPVNDFFDEIPALDPMSEPEHIGSIAQSDASEASSAVPSRKRRHSNTTDRDISIEQVRRDDSPPDDSGNEDSSNSDASSDDEAPPPPRGRRRVSRGEWGQLRHIVDIEGANLPNAPPFVARQREVYDNVSLAATEQIEVVRGIDFVAALYRSGHVVYQGQYRGAPTGAAIFREARQQPVLVWQDMENRVVRIAAGDDHLVMLTISGEVHTIGRSAEGQLGIPDLRGFRQSIVTPASMLRPIRNAAGQNVFITDVRAQGNITEAKMRNGTVYRCGDGVLQFTEVPN